MTKKERNKLYYKKNKDRFKERVKKYQVKNKEKIKKYKADLYKKNKDKVRDERIKRLYGIDTAEFNRMYEEQGKVCKLCKNELLEGYHRDKHIDHCHKTGVVRGILCSKCNLMIGLAKDNKETLLRAYKYLNNVNKIDV